MAKRDFFLRYGFIIKKLQNSFNKQVSYEEINEYLENEFGMIDKPKGISKRTLQRELNELRTNFYIDIKCNSDNKYYIAEPEGEDEDADIRLKMLEAFDIVNSLSSGKRLANYILPEKRCPTGTEHIYGLLHAIRNRLFVIITHQAYGYNEALEYKLEPYAIKEFNGMWYLLAREALVTNERQLSSNERQQPFMKTYGLDRIKSIDISRKKYKYPAELNVSEYFKDCYGISRPYGDDEQAEEIILEFDKLQGNYIKSYPWHESQTVLEDDEEGLTIRLKLYITYELKMKILSYGDRVRVLAPKKLQEEIREVLEASLEKYNSSE